MIRPVAGGGSKFPPCMGGCIVHIKDFLNKKRVSSLYGRVYHDIPQHSYTYQSFLPVWEGVSMRYLTTQISNKFPPCMGGCIGKRESPSTPPGVSSLQGRVCYSY